MNENLKIKDDIQKNIEVKVEEKKEKDTNIKISLEIRIIGWMGSILIITAYSLNSLGYITADNITYPVLNLFGAILISIRVYTSRNWSNLFLEAF